MVQTEAQYKFIYMAVSKYISMAREGTLVGEGGWKVGGCCGWGACVYICTYGSIVKVQHVNSSQIPSPQQPMASSVLPVAGRSVPPLPGSGNGVDSAYANLSYIQVYT